MTTEIEKIQMMTRRHIPTHAEFYRICEWLKTIELEGSITLASIAQAASKSLGMTVSTSTVKSAMTATGLLLPKAPEPAKKTLAELEAEVAGLRAELEKLVGIVETLARVVGSQRSQDPELVLHFNAQAGKVLL